MIPNDRSSNVFTSNRNCRPYVTNTCLLKRFNGNSQFYFLFFIHERVTNRPKKNSINNKTIFAKYVLENFLEWLSHSWCVCVCVFLNRNKLNENLLSAYIYCTHVRTLAHAQGYSSAAWILNALLSFISSIFHLWEVKWIGIHLHSNLMVCYTFCDGKPQRVKISRHHCWPLLQLLLHTLAIQFSEQPSVPMNRSPTNKPICICNDFMRRGK